MFNYDDFINLHPDNDLDVERYLSLSECNICGKHFANVRYLIGDEYCYIAPSHYDYGACSIECWSEHDNFYDEYQADRFTEENLEAAEELAKHWEKYLKQEDDEENIQ